MKIQESSGPETFSKRETYLQKHTSEELSQTLDKENTTYFQTYVKLYSGAASNTVKNHIKIDKDMEMLQENENIDK